MTTTDLVPAAASSTLDALQLVDPAAKLVRQIADTTFVPPAWRGKPGELLAAILTGHELGLGPMAAIGKIHNIQGRATLSAEAGRAIVQARGHEIWLEDVSSQRVTACGRRRGEENVVRITWTIDDAKRAGLTGKEVWRKFPKAMLVARASADLCRAHFADCLSGISWFQEELEDGALDEDGAPVVEDVEERPAAPAKKRTAKLPAKKAARTARKAPPPPAPAPPPDPVADFEELDAVAQAPAGSGDDVVDAVLVEDEDQVPGVEVADEPALPPDRALAKRAREVGLGDELRHGMYVAITAGRARSGKELTADEIAVAFDLLAAAEEGRLRVAEDEPGCWTVYVDGEDAWFGVDAAAADAAGSDVGLPTDGDGWRDLCKAEGRKVAEVLMASRRLAGELGVDAPKSLGDLGDAPDLLRRAVADWLGGVS